MTSGAIIVSLLVSKDIPTKMREFLKTNPNSIDLKFPYVNRVGDGTLLHWCCILNRPKTTQVLLQHGADKDISFSSPDWSSYGIFNGLTAYQIAQKRQFDQIITLFEQITYLPPPTTTNEKVPKRVKRKKKDEIIINLKLALVKKEEELKTVKSETEEILKQLTAEAVQLMSDKEKVDKLMLETQTKIVKQDQTIVELKNMVESLTWELKTKEENWLCVVCLHEKREYMCTPCGHLLYCEKCVGVMRRKPCAVCCQEATICKIYL